MMSNDGTTISLGWAYGGTLRQGARLPRRGTGWRIPPRWLERGNRYGTYELISLVKRVARRVHREARRSVVGIADLSPEGGGPSRWHRSHQSGRDVDVLLFARDGRGRRLSSRAMIGFKLDGSSKRRCTHGQRWSKRFFDAERNWLLIRAFLDDPKTEVQYLYLYEPLKQLVLAHARRIGEPAWLVAYADAIIAQPIGSSRHHDHLHVRIYCPANDLQFACKDGPSATWRRSAYRLTFAGTRAALHWLRGLLMGSRPASGRPPVPVLRPLRTGQQRYETAQLDRLRRLEP
jgi:penicillin-insensitive murein DD-endopeptidase